MKVCTACGETYRDYIDFCFTDGEVLRAAADVLPQNGAGVGVTLVPQASLVTEAEPSAREVPGPGAKQALLNRTEADAEKSVAKGLFTEDTQPKLVSPTSPQGEDDDEDDEIEPKGAAFSQADTIPIPRRTRTPTPSGPRPLPGKNRPAASRDAGDNEEESGPTKMLIFSVVGMALVFLLGGGTMIVVGVTSILQTTSQPVADVVPATPGDAHGPVHIDPVEAAIAANAAVREAAAAEEEDDEIDEPAGTQVAKVTPAPPRPAPAEKAPTAEVPAPSVAPAPAKAPKPEASPAPEPAPAAPDPAPATPEPAPVAPAPVPNPVVEPAKIATPSPEPEASPAPQTPAIGSIRIRSTPSGAKATIAGEQVGMTPVMVELPVGTHEVTLELVGYAPMVRNIEVTEGTSELPAWSLERAGSDGSTVSLMVFYAGRIGDDLYVNGALVGKLPTRVELPEGDHEFRVSGSNIEDAVVTRTVVSQDGGVSFIRLTED